MSLGYADLPRQTTADYLTGCTDPNERKLAPGRTEADVPSTPEALEAAFKKSEIYAQTITERDAFVAEGQENEKKRQDFREAVLTDKRLGSRKSSPFTASFGAQVYALMKRQ
jgi:ATP-binding cassette subfamily G (WHITE) protein 2 (SNQ2)